MIYGGRKTISWIARRIIPYMVSTYGVYWSSERRCGKKAPAKVVYWDMIACDGTKSAISVDISFQVLEAGSLVIARYCAVNTR